MKKTHKVLLALLGIIVMTVAGFKAMQPKEPEYQGRRLSEWVRDLEKPPPKSTKAKEVIRTMDTAAITWIERQAASQRNPMPITSFQKTLRDVQRRFGLIDEVAQYERWWGYFSSLEVIGTDAVPVLERLLRNSECAFDAAMSLAKMDAIEALERGATAENKDFVRQSVASAFGEVAVRKNRACDNLLVLALDPDPEVVKSAAYALGNLREKPEESVARLRELLRQNNKVFQSQVIFSLGEFGNYGATALPDLEKVKSSADPKLKGEIEAVIQRIKP